MIIHKLMATFGALLGEELLLGSGLNVIYAPNGRGKSTWSAFIRAILFGINTSERDTKTSLSEKKRYLPWSGPSMSGRMEFSWRGGRSLMERRTVSAPMRDFKIISAETGDAVPGMSADDAGEVILGMSRECFERSAFITLPGIGISGTPELERRIHSMLSSGEEGVSYSETRERLRAWQRERSAKGRGELLKIDRRLVGLDREIEAYAETGNRIVELRADIERLSHGRSEALNQIGIIRRVEELTRAREAMDAERALREAEALYNDLRSVGAEALPPSDAFPELFRELASIEAESAVLSRDRAELQRLEASCVELRERASGYAAFAGAPPEEAVRRARDDAYRAAELMKSSHGRKRRVRAAHVSIISGGLTVLAAALMFAVTPWAVFIPLAAFLLSTGMTIRELVAARKDAAARAGAAEILKRYGALSPEDILRDAESFYHCRASLAMEEKLCSEVGGRAARATESLNAASRPFFTKIQGFCEAAKSAEEARAALESAAEKAVALRDAARRAASASAVFEALSRDIGNVKIGPGGENVEAKMTLQEAEGLLTRLDGELLAARDECARLEGASDSMEDPAGMASEREALSLRREALVNENEALEISLAALEEAHAEMRKRFSPALNARAGEIFGEITGGAYSKVTVDSAFLPKADFGGRLLNPWELSGGTADQMYLALRLAISEMMSLPEEACPLFLDDVFATFDDSRMKNAVDFLLRAVQERQVFLFTCHSREGAYLAGRSGVTLISL